MITSAIKQLLLQQSAVTGIVESRIRIYAIGPNEQLPAIDIRSVASGDTPQSLDGYKPGFVSYLTIDCYSKDNHAQADTLAGLLYSQSVLGFRGTIGGVTIRGITADGAPEQSSETADPASEKKRYVTSVGYEVSWSV